LEASKVNKVKLTQVEFNYVKCSPEKPSEVNECQVDSSNVNLIQMWPEKVK